MANKIRDCIAPDRNPRRPNLKLPAGSVDTHVHVFDFKYPFSPARGYNPPEATLTQLSHMHDVIGVDRVVFTQPSVYGTDNTAMMDSVAVLNEANKDCARAIISCSPDITDSELEEFNIAGVRGLRFNMDNAGGMSVTLDDLPRLADRIRPLSWHMEFLFAGEEFIDLLPIFKSLSTPISIAHFAYQNAVAGVEAPGFQALLNLVREGNTWIKISGANRVSATGMPPFDDVKPLAEALIEANSSCLVWGTDWPHPNIFDENPNDGDLVDALGDWISDKKILQKLLIDNPANFYKF